MSGRGTVYRMGGDEFCVFTWAADSERVLEDARLALSDKGEGFVIRCSCGVALVPTEAATLERAIQIADERLYKDKRANRVTDTLQVRDALVQLIAEQRQELAPNTVNVADLAAATATRLGLSRRGDRVHAHRGRAARHRQDGDARGDPQQDRPAGPGRVGTSCSGTP